MNAQKIPNKPIKAVGRLSETCGGLYLPDNHARMIWQGNKSLIVQPRLYGNVAGKKFYLVSNNMAYGIMTIGNPTTIGVKEFDALSDRHRITNKERQDWWSGKKVLFAYPFKLDVKFEQPLRVAIPNNSKTFIESVQFLEEQTMIRDVANYDPSKLGSDVLRDDFRIALAWWSSKKEGKGIKYSVEEIENLIQLIMEELLRRGTRFHPESMAPNSKEAFDRILPKAEKNLSSHMPDFLGEFEDAVLIKDFISLVGSSVKDENPNDADILVRAGKDTLFDFLSRAVQARMNKMHSDEKEMHFIFGDSEGPHDSFIPIYDLALVKRAPRYVEMSESVSPLVPFFPMKPGKKFYSIEEAANYMFGG